MSLNPAELLNRIFNALDSLIENDGVCLYLVIVWLGLLAVGCIFSSGLRKRMKLRHGHFRNHFHDTTAEAIPAVNHRHRSRRVRKERWRKVNASCKRAVGMGAVVLCGSCSSRLAPHKADWQCPRENHCHAWLILPRHKASIFSIATLCTGCAIRVKINRGRHQTPQSPSGFLNKIGRFLDDLASGLIRQTKCFQVGYIVLGRLPFT
jgi:hypothetical protein